MKSLIKTLTFNFIVILLFFFLIEIFTRIFFTINLGPKSFFFGIDKNIRIQIIKLKSFDFKLIEIKENKIYKINKNQSNKNIFVFGGSTSFGENCEDSNLIPRSWVNYMQEQLKDYNIKNFAQNGLMSNNSLQIFSNYIKNNNSHLESPDIIIWAHRYNDLFIKLYNKKQKILLLRLNKTLENKSLFYFLFSAIINRLYKFDTGNFNPQKNEDYTQEEIKSILENYNYHTSLAIRLSKELDSKFIILILPSKYNLFEEKYFQYPFSEALKSEMIRISIENNVYFYDMENDAKNLFLPNVEYFCDDIHPTDEGAKVISKLVKTYLGKKFKIVE